MLVTHLTTHYLNAHCSLVPVLLLTSADIRYLTLSVKIGHCLHYGISQQRQLFPEPPLRVLSSNHKFLHTLNISAVRLLLLSLRLISLTSRRRTPVCPVYKSMYFSDVAFTTTMTGEVFKNGVVLKGSTIDANSNIAASVPHQLSVSDKLHWRARLMQYFPSYWQPLYVAGKMSLPTS
jgi:hypothetical protein